MLRGSNARLCPPTLHMQCLARDAGAYRQRLFACMGNVYSRSTLPDREVHCYR